MYGFRNISLVVLLALTTSCASYEASVDALRNIHEEPEIQAQNPPVEGMDSFLKYAEIVKDEEMKDPIGFCTSAIQELQEKVYDDGTEMAPITFILCLTARRSPSMLVRASAMRALRKIFTPKAPEFQPLTALAASEDFRSNLEKIAILFRDRIAPARMDAAGWEEYWTLVRYFGFVGVNRANWAREALKIVGRTQPFGEKDPAALAKYQKTMDVLNLQAFFLTSLEGMVDPEMIVRSEAIENLFLFNWETLRDPLLENLEYNKYLDDPLHRIHMIRKLKALGGRPETINMRILEYVVRGLDYSNAGVSFHSVEFLKDFMGMEEDDPGFWQDWWKEYLVDHAGE